MTQACLLFLNVLPAAANGTLANTAIVNTATAAYSDINATAYTASMTLTVYVQNAPSFTMTSPTGKFVTVGENVIDTFSLTNTGNASGNFVLAADATAAGTGGTSTLLGYVLNGATTSTCSTQSPCILSALQTALAAATATAPNNATPVTIGVVYAVTSTAYAGTFLYSIAPAISYPAQGTTAAVTSSTTTSTAFTDTIQADARLDIKVVSTPPPSAGGDLTWVVTANNGGNYPAHDLASTQSLFGAAAPGVAMFIQVPVYSSAALALVGTPAAPTVTNDTVTMYYSHKAVGSVPTLPADWNSTPAAATWIAIYLSANTGGLGNELPSATGGSTGAGVVGVSPQVSFTFTTAAPASSTPSAVTLVVNSAIGGNVWDTGTIYPMVGPNIAVGAADLAANVQLVEANTTAGSPSGAWAGGASNLVGNQAYGMSVVIGPLKLPGGTGSYPGPGNLGAAAASNLLDYTAMGFACSGGTGVYGGGANCTAPANIQIPNTVQNLGNLADTITISVTPPAGWTAQIFTASGCPTPTTTVPTCTGLSSISAVSSAGTIVTSSGILLAALTGVQDYVVQYNATVGTTPFVAVDALVTANGTGDTNNTHNDLYPGGVINIITTSSVPSGNGNCPSGVLLTTVCPGGLIKYVTTYSNVAPALSVANGANVGTEPSFAYAALMLGGSLTIVSDGQATWGTYTFGLDGTAVSGAAVPAASDASNTTVTTYLNGTSNSTWAAGTYVTGGTGISTGPNKVQAVVANASTTLAPGGSGTLTYYVTVK